MNIRLLIMTPLPVEYAAVRRHINITEEPIFHDGGAFETGTFQGKHHQYTVILREPGMHNTEMALACEKAIRRFQPHICLLVGIAGGVKDVNIGDVLIASKVYGYENGKEDTDGFKARPAVESFSHQLLARTQILSRHENWKKRTADGADSATVLTGALAAGEKVVADTNNSTYQRIKLHYNDTLGLEMEAIGFATALQNYRQIHGLAIRGISDLCAGKAITDQHNWQPVAADRAAAVAVELLWELDASTFINTQMDTKAIAKTIYELLFPIPESFKEIGNDFSNAANNDVREIWKRVKPIFINEVTEAAQDPGDTALRGVAEVALRKGLEQQPELQKTLADLLSKSAVANPSFNIINSENVVAGSTITVQGDFRIGNG